MPAPLYASLNSGLAHPERLMGDDAPQIVGYWTGGSHDDKDSAGVHP